MPTAITRGCRTTGTPHWSPHHAAPAITSWHPIPRVAAFVGHASGSMRIDTYAHVLLEATELEYAALIA